MAKLLFAMCVPLLQLILSAQLPALVENRTMENHLSLMPENNHGLMSQFIDRGKKQVAKRLMLEAMKKVKLPANAAPLILLPALLAKNTFDEVSPKHNVPSPPVPDKPIDYPKANPLMVVDQLKRRYPFGDEQLATANKRLKLDETSKWSAAGASGGGFGSLTVDVMGGGVHQQNVSPFGGRTRTESPAGMRAFKMNELIGRPFA